MTAAVYLSVVTQKLRLRLRMCCAHVSYIYLIHTYINIYKRYVWGARPIRAAWLLLVFVTGTMKNYTSITT